MILLSYYTVILKTDFLNYYIEMDIATVISAFNFSSLEPPFPVSTLTACLFLKFGELSNCSFVFSLCVERLDCVEIGSLNGREFSNLEFAFGSPAVEMSGCFRADSISQENNHVEVIERNLSCHLPRALLTNLSEFPTG